MRTNEAAATAGTETGEQDIKSGNKKVMFAELRIKVVKIIKKNRFLK